MTFADLACASVPSNCLAQVGPRLEISRSLKAGMAVALASAALLSHADDLTQIDVPAVESAEMTYSAFDPTHTLIGESALIEALQRAAHAATQYPAKKTHAGQFHYVKGLHVDVDTSKHLLILQYESLRRNGHDDSIGTTRSFGIGYRRLSSVTEPTFERPRFP